MSRYRLYPSAAQETILREHCAHARYVWNLAAEQQSWWRPGRKSAPGWVEQCRQLTEARRDFPWLAAGSQNVQQQAIRDHAQAMRNYFNGTHRKPGWRKADRNEGFRITATCQVQRLNRRWGQVAVPKIGWVRFRWTRPVPDAKSYRVTLNRAGRWHVAFAAAPAAISAPGNGEVVGIDRGVAVSLALSTGELFSIPHPSGDTERLARRLSRAKQGSGRRKATKTRLAKMKALDANRRRDWAEKMSTDIARRFDLIRIEDLQIVNMTRRSRPIPDLDQPGRFLPNGGRAKTGLTRGVLASGWGFFARRLEDKAPGRVEKVNPAYTSQRCSACGHVSQESRKSQADFQCTACTYTGNADVNAARNIAAGRAVTARGGPGLPGPANREPLGGAA